MDTWCSYWQLFPVTVHLTSGLRPINTLCTHKHRTHNTNTQQRNIIFLLVQTNSVQFWLRFTGVCMHVFLLRLFLHPEWMSLLNKHAWTFVSRLFPVIYYLVLYSCKTFNIQNLFALLHCKNLWIFFKKMLWFFYLKTSCLIQCAIFYYYLWNLQAISQWVLFKKTQCTYGFTIGICRSSWCTKWLFPFTNPNNNAMTPIVPLWAEAG